MAVDPKVLKVGIVGLSHLHPRSYMPLFAAEPNLNVVAVCEENDALRTDFIKDFEVAGYATLDKMLNSEELDIAAIFLPHADCPAAARRCATEGIHLMVEKPMAASAAGAEEIVAAAEGAGVKLTTGYCWRLHPVAVELRRLIQSGVIGQIVAGEGRCAAGRLSRYILGNSAWMLDPKRSGGGPMFNLGVHWIDLFRWVLNSEVTEVSGRNVKVNNEYAIEDNSLAHLQFGNGAIVALDISYTVPDSFPHGRDLYLSVRGTKGVISWAPGYEGEEDILEICSDAAEFSGAPRRRQVFELETFTGYSGYMGRAYVHAFAECIRQNVKPPITGEDGVAALKIVEGVYTAAEQKRWITI